MFFPLYFVCGCVLLMGLVAWIKFDWLIDWLIGIGDDDTDDDDVGSETELMARLLHHYNKHEPPRSSVLCLLCLSTTRR